MASVSKVHFFIIIFIISGTTLWELKESLAQIGPRFALLEPGIINSVGFVQNFNAYQWYYDVNYQKVWGERHLIKLTENFRSSLLRIGERENKWKDDQKFVLDFMYPVLPTLAFKAMAASLIFSDRQSGLINDIATISGTIGVLFTPKEKIKISSDLGRKWDKRFDQLENGVTYDWDVNLNDFEFQGYNNNLGVMARGDYFNVRQNRDWGLVYDVSKEFYIDTFDSLRIVFDKKRRDNYDRTESGQLYIESWEEELKRLENTLTYRITSGLNISINSSVSLQDAQLSKIVKEKKGESRKKVDYYSSNGINLSFRGSFWDGFTSLKYSTQSQRNKLPDSLKSAPFSRRISYLPPDFQSSQLAFLSRLGLSVSSADSLLFLFSTSLFQYNTPEDNPDDRDELGINLSFSAIHTFNQDLKLRLNTTVNLFHLVYIFGERSADNNWKRVFRLYPEIYYSPSSKLKLYQSFEVLANYVDYDYEYENNISQVRSFVFRKFSAQDSLVYQWTRRSYLNLDYRLELEEQGKLCWQEWTERPLIARQNHWLRLTVSYQPHEGFILSTGIVVYKRFEWRYTLDKQGTFHKEKQGDFTSYGPLLKVSYHPSSRLKFEFYGMRQAVERTQEQKRFINNIDIHLNWYL